MSKRCAACGKPASKEPNPGFMFLGKDVPLCDGCWSDGENNSAWNDRIEQRIRDRRAGKKTKRKTFSVLVTVKHTWSLRGIEAEDEDAAGAQVKAMELDELERYGHEIDCDVDVDSIDQESSK